MTTLTKDKMYIVLKPFKYEVNGTTTLLKRGDEFIPVGGKWDHILTDPEKHYVKIEDRKPEPKPKAKAKTKPKTKVKTKVYKCEYCSKPFTSPQGRGAHKRFCKQKE